MLEGKYTADTTFPPTDHRSHRPKSWLINGPQENRDAAVPRWPRPVRSVRPRCNGSSPITRVASCLPNIYDAEQLKEFATAPDSPAFTTDELARVAELANENFGIPDEKPNYKGTMTRETAAA